MNDRFLFSRRRKPYSTDCSSRKIPRIGSWSKSQCTTWRFASRRWGLSRSAPCALMHVCTKSTRNTYFPSFRAPRKQNWKSWSTKWRSTCKSAPCSRNCTDTRKPCAMPSEPYRYHSTWSMICSSYVKSTIISLFEPKNGNKRSTTSKNERATTVAKARIARSKTWSFTMTPSRCSSEQPTESTQLYKKLPPEWLNIKEINLRQKQQKVDRKKTKSSAMGMISTFRRR